MLRVFLCIALIASFNCPTAVAEEEADSFSGILQTELRGTFGKITDYVQANPKAADAEQAWQWLFTTALQHGLELDALELASAYRTGPGSNQTTRALAQQITILGSAKSGKGNEAVELFAAQLRFSRVNAGGPQIEFGKRLATELCMARDFAAAREVYSQISSRFFLNADVRAMCENKSAKTELIDQPAPEINVADTAGETVDLTALNGKVTLIDFWATNCPPCIEEMPNLKRLYSRYHEKGFEIVGVSLDGDQSIVDQFTQSRKIPWRMIVDEADVRTLRERYQVRLIPSLYLIDQAGNVVQFDVKGANLKKSIETLLNSDS